MYTVGGCTKILVFGNGIKRKGINGFVWSD
jgi:hypothetical protein